MKYGVLALFVLLAIISWTLIRFERNAEFGSTRLAVKVDGDNRLPCPPGVPPSIDNIEDYDWIYCTSDLRPFWASLNITENKFTESDSVSEAASTFGDLDRDGNDERILRLTLGRSMIRFVILKRDADRNVWKPLAHLDMSDFHLAPEARVVSNGHTNWLAISNDEHGWGTGILQENQTWYELKDGRLIQVLSVPEEVDERIAPDTIHRQVNTGLATVPFDGVRDRVEVVFKAVLSLGSDDKDKVTIRHRVVFAKRPKAKQFQFDEVDSDISERTYRLLCDLENATPKDEEELVSLLSQYKSK